MSREKTAGADLCVRPSKGNTRLSEEGPVKIRKRPLPEKRLSNSRNLCYNLPMNENAVNLSRLPPPLLAWYRENARDLPWRKTTDPYRIWVSEIMLQQTRVAAVLGYYARFLAAFPTAEALASAPEDQLMKLWEGLGYYSRARNLQKAARLVADRGGFPDTCAGLLELPGIGDYTAAAIASAAFARREAAVDGNVLRVVTRLTDDHSDIAAPQTKKSIRLQVQDIFPKKAEDIRIFNQALMELGATVCVPNGPPKCLFCPVRDLCLGRERGTAESLPVKAPKKSRRVEDKTVFLLLREGRAALRKRPASGLLARLWEFPNVESALDEPAAAVAVRAWGLEPLAWKRRLTAKHIFSHVEWRMTGYALEVSGEGPEDFTWVDTLERHAVPSAFSRFTEEVRRELEK
jgi:A/G-specific adenine glycosylase